MRFAVALVALLSLGSDVWASVAVNHPYTHYGGDFIKIDPHGPYDSSVSEAGQAGPAQMRVGDRFSAAALTFDQRLQLYGYEKIDQNERLHLSILRNGSIVPVVLSPIEIRYITGQPQVNTNLSILISLIILAIGLALLLLRPSPYTAIGRRRNVVRRSRRRTAVFLPVDEKRTMLRHCRARGGPRFRLPGFGIERARKARRRRIESAVAKQLPSRATVGGFGGIGGFGGSGKLFVKRLERLAPQK